MNEKLINNIENSLKEEVLPFLYDLMIYHNMTKIEIPTEHPSGKNDLNYRKINLTTQKEITRHHETYVDPYGNIFHSITLRERIITITKKEFVEDAIDNIQEFLFNNAKYANTYSDYKFDYQCGEQVKTILFYLNKKIKFLKDFEKNTNSILKQITDLNPIHTRKILIEKSKK